jgi:hypothetical protein
MNGNMPLDDFCGVNQLAKFPAEYAKQIKALE